MIKEPRLENLPERCREVSGLICPGFVDLQINGAFAADIGPEAKALRTLAARLPSTGVTSFLPTLISSPADLCDGFFAVLEEVETAPGARILGAHLEAPFLAPSRKGAHDPGNISPVDLGLLHHLLASGRVTVMTLAPELPVAVEAIGLLAEAARLASEVPAAALGLRHKGGLSAGYDADLVVLDGEGSVRQTIVGGEVVYGGDEATRTPKSTTRGGSAT